MEKSELLALLYPCYSRLPNVRLQPEEKECFDFWCWYVDQKVKGNIKGIGTHVAHQVANNRSPLFGHKLALMGKIRGIPDYLFIKSDKGLGIEFKAGKNKQSVSQQQIERWFSDEKVPYYLVKSKEEAIDALQREGFINEN